MRPCQVVARLTLAVALSWTALASAQVAGADNEPDAEEPGGSAAAETATPTEVPEELFESRVMDEITVVVGPDGRTAFDMEMERQAQIREAIYAEMRMREREQEELAWRQADRDLENPESRIKWGYSPQAEQRMRRENDFIYDLPFEQTKPATVFRAEF